MSITYIDGVSFKHSMGQEKLSQALAQVTLSREIARLLRGELQVAIKGLPSDQSHCCAKFLWSTDAALASAVRANKELSDRHRASLERCFKISSMLQMDGPITEPVVVRPRPKNGGFRATHNFGIRHRMSQDMVRGVMDCHLVPRDFQYTFLGTHKAIADAKQFLKQGLVHFATLDIKEFFGSFKASLLAAELPLPKEWVDYVVIGRHMAVVADMNGLKCPTIIPTHTLLHQARQGIPLGSSCASVVAGFCMSRLHWETSLGVAMLNYSDNFLILASTKKRLEKGIGRLEKAVANLPGGHFDLKLISAGHASEGLEFLGHTIKKVGGIIETSPSYANENGFLREVIKLGEKVIAASHAGNKLKAIKHLQVLCAAIKGWVQAFQECDRIAEREVFLLSHLQDDAAALGLKIETIYAGVNADPQYAAASYVSGL